MPRQTDPKNYGFVEFLKPQFFIDGKTRRRKPAVPYYGYLDLEIVTVDPLFIGSGMSQLEKDDIYAETMHENGRLLIPGSSLKGAVRQLCRAMSRSCIPDAKEVRKVGKFEEKRVTKIPSDFVLDCKASDQKLCIVCDMFGRLSAASKVRFTDFYAEGDGMVPLYVPQQFSPDKSKSSYLYNDVHRGYKFYNTHCQKRSAAKSIAIKAAGKGTSFFGRVYFKDLHERELQLLLFGLTQSRLFDLKLGGYKADGLGTVKLYCSQFVLNGESVGADAAEDYAMAYEQYVDQDKDLPDLLDDLIEILKPKE